MNCPNCGNPMGAEDIFCANCGTQLPAPVGSTPYPPEANTPTAPVKKKSKKKIIIITAIVTALAIIAGILSWVFIFSKDPESPDDPIWLVASETAYEADGSKGYYQNLYTYTDKGLPLKFTYDRGERQQIWNDDEGVYASIYLPFDGQIDETYDFGYNEKGDSLYYTRTGLDLNEGDKDCNYTYHYDKDGRIESIDQYSVQIGGGHSDEVAAITHYCYDDNGALIEVYTENLLTETTNWNWDFRYDDEGRLIGLTIRQMDACYYYQYEYNDNDQLTRATLSTAPGQTRLDDQHVSESSYACDNEFSTRSEWQFSYDSNGNLISRGDTTCTYDSNGKLSTVTYSDGNTYRYTDSDTGADDSDIVLVRDENGNVTKKIYPDGSYIEYTYREFHLSAEEAQYCRNAQMCWNQIAPTGTALYFLGFGGPSGFLKYLPIPTTALLQTDLLHKGDT